MGVQVRDSYVVNVLVRDEEDELFAMNSGLLENSFKIVSKVRVAVAFFQIQLKHFTVRYERCQLNNCVLSSSVQANEQQMSA